MKAGDYVRCTQTTGEIVIDSVGLLKDISDIIATVHFVGLNKIVRINYQRIEFLDVTKTGKGFDKKICNICHILKKTSEFDVNQIDAKGGKTTRPSCKSCRIGIDGVHLKQSERQRMDTIKPKGIFTCPICHKTTIVGVTANLVRDHDHKTGEGREWICDSCNTGLGRFKDDEKLLGELIDYLKKFNSKTD